MFNLYNKSISNPLVRLQANKKNSISIVFAVCPNQKGKNKMKMKPSSVSLYIIYKEKNKSSTAQAEKENTAMKSLCFHITEKKNLYNNTIIDYFFIHSSVCVFPSVRTYCPILYKECMQIITTNLNA